MVKARSRRWLGALALGLGSLEPACYEPPPCTSEAECVAWDEGAIGATLMTFEDACIGPDCQVSIVRGSPSFGASLHPVERALHLPTGSAVTLHTTLPGVPDGAVLNVNVRCDEGTSLWFDGDGVSPEGFPIRLETVPVWRRIRVAVREPQQSFDNIPAARGEAQYTLALHTDGPGACALDQLYYANFIQVCTLGREPSGRSCDGPIP